MGASNYTCAETSWSQQLVDWIGAHVRALTFLGAVPEIVVPDKLKSVVRRVTREFRLEPGIEINRHRSNASETASDTTKPRRGRPRGFALTMTIESLWFAPRELLDT